MSNRVNLAIAVALAVGALTWLLGAAQIRHMLLTDHIGEGGLATFIGLATLVLSASLIARYVPLVRAEAPATTAPLNEPGDEEPDLPASWTRPLIFMAACGLWTVVLNPLGFLIATPFFIAAQLWLLGYRDPVRLVLISVFAAFAIWFVFDFVLGVNLPGGLHHSLTDRLRL